MRLGEPLRPEMGSGTEEVRVMAKADLPILKLVVKDLELSNGLGTHGYRVLSQTKIDGNPIREDESLIIIFSADLPLLYDVLAFGLADRERTQEIFRVEYLPQLPSGIRPEDQERMNEDIRLHILKKAVEASRKARLTAMSSTNT